MKTQPITLIFTLSMPGCSSWNGRWSGEDRVYAMRHKFTSAKGIEQAQQILAREYYSYNFGDGWRAGISVKQVDSITAKKIMSKSAGFCGYDWMVESILSNGDIL